MKISGCHGNELPIKEILYQSVFGDKYYMIGHKFTISVTMDVSPFAWCFARAVLKMSTIFGITFMRRINTISQCSKQEFIFIFQYFNFYELLKFLAQLS